MVIVKFYPSVFASHMKKALAAVAFFGALVMVAHCGSGCQDAKDSLSDPAHNYAAEIIACAATAGYPGAYDRAADMRCRNEVNCRYQLPSCMGQSDAGR